MSETICKTCGRSDCERLTIPWWRIDNGPGEPLRIGPDFDLARTLQSTNKPDPWPEWWYTFGEFPRRLDDKSARAYARAQCAARAVDWFARCQELRAELDARESAWLISAPHGSPSDCPCWYDKCLCTVENFAATIERAKQAESQLERLVSRVEWLEMTTESR